MSGNTGFSPDLRSGRERRRRLWLAAKHGWPKSYPLVQFPNVPLGFVTLSLLTAMVTTGGAHDAAQSIGRTFQAIWGYLELTSGINGFRRALGGVVLAAAVWLLVA